MQKIYYVPSGNGWYELRKDKSDITRYVLVQGKIGLYEYCKANGFKPKRVLKFKANRLGKGVC